jgi:hypothetical protein
MEPVAPLTPLLHKEVKHHDQLLVNAVDSYKLNSLGNNNIYMLKFNYFVRVLPSLFSRSELKRRGESCTI